MNWTSEVGTEEESQCRWTLGVGGNRVDVLGHSQNLMSWGLPSRAGQAPCRRPSRSSATCPSCGPVIPAASL